MGKSLSCLAKNREPIEETILEGPKSKKLQSAPGMDTTTSNGVPSVECAVFPPMPADFEPTIVECMTGKDPPKHGTYPFENTTQKVSPVNSAIPSQVEEAFGSIDEHAFRVSQREQASFLELIWQLIYSRPITKPVEKVRAIFYWVCTKDFQKLTYNNVEADTPESTLYGIKEGRTNYAHIFQTLCSYSGLVCKVIRGYAKAIGYRPGMKIGGLNAQHVWNAVLVDGTWRLIDCYSAAHRIIAKPLTWDLVKTDLDNFYFMPEPSHLRLIHYPLEEKWQLLEHPTELTTFESLAPVRSAFFKFGLELFSHPHGIINSQEQLILKIKYPEHFIDKISFTFTLNLEGLGEIYKGSNMQRYGMHETTVNPRVATFTLRFPKSGVFRLVLYARMVGEQVFGAVCEHRVEVELPTDSDGNPIRKALPFPPTQQASYGRTEHAKQYDLRSSHQNSAVLRVNNGSIDVRFFFASKDENLPQLMARLKSTSIQDDCLQQCILLRTVIADGDHKSIVVAAYLPEPGEYALEIYASDSDNDEASLFLVWQFLLISDSASPLQGLPTLPSNALGPLGKFVSMGLSTISHRDPLIRVPTATQAGSDDMGSDWHCLGGDLGIELGLPIATAQRERIRLLAQFVYATNDEDTDYSEYVLQQMRDNHAALVLRFPKPGYYKLHIHALPYADPDDNIPEVYTYLIDAPPRLSAKDKPYMGSTLGPFPQQMAMWKEGCFLEEPFDERLIVEDGKPCRFTAHVTKTNAVGVMINDQWNALEGEGTKFTGEIVLPNEPGTPIRLCARYGAHAGNYSILLEYKISEAK